jgi:hypothetical protein
VIFSGIAAGATVLLVFVTGALWFATYRLYRGTVRAIEGEEKAAKAMSRLAKTARRTGERQLRAYVYQHSIKLTKFSLTEPMEFTVSICNAGSTPASEFECHGVAFLASLPLLDETVMPEPAEDLTVGRHSKGALFPGVERQMDCDCIDQFLGADVIGGINEPRPKIAIYVAGGMRYQDVFGRSHDTTFCEYMSGEDAVRLIEAEQGLRPLPPGFIVRFITSHIHNSFT